jgi:2-polyprenyl-3-methyl-5-hydroxy-6-metoxy-1,4-benzoquinol methylase
MSTTSSVAAGSEADRALKNRHRAMWALGNYPAVVEQIIAGLGPILVEACGVEAGDRVLDVAAGTGNAAIPAALAGATVTASDLTPELLEVGRYGGTRSMSAARSATGSPVCRCAGSS